MRKPRTKEWTGLWQGCPLCGRTMDMILQRGRKVYHCPDCTNTQLCLPLGVEL